MNVMALPPFQSLLDDHAGDVRRFLIATVGHGAADDCGQETWLAALRAYPRLRDASNLRGWLLTIAHRKAIDHVRADRRAPVVAAVAVESAGGTEVVLPDEELWERVRSLPPKQRSALALRFVLDLSHGEIAAAMGTTAEAARRNVHEGLTRLRRELDADDR